MTGNRKYVEKTAAVAVLQPLHTHTTYIVCTYVCKSNFLRHRSLQRISIMHDFFSPDKTFEPHFYYMYNEIWGASLFIKRFSNNRNWVNLIVSMVHICNSCKCNYFNCHGQNMYLGIYWTVEAIANFCEVKIVPLLSKCS